MPEGDTGARHDHAGALHELDEKRRRGLLHDLGAGGIGGRDSVEVRVVTGRHVFDHDDVIARRGAVAYHGVTGDTEPEHEHAAQSITPGIRMKSA